MHDDTARHFTAWPMDLSQVRSFTQPGLGLATGPYFVGIGFSCPWGRAYLVKDTPFQASVWSHVACSHRAYVHMWSTFPPSHDTHQRL